MVTLVHYSCVFLFALRGSDARVWFAESDL